MKKYKEILMFILILAINIGAKSQCTSALEKLYPTPVLNGVGGYGSVLAIKDNIAVVGAPQSDSLDLSAGIVYVYEYANTNWKEIARLTPSDPKAFLEFGYSLDISENIIAVGVPYYSEHHSNGGAVYIFRKGVDGWESKSESFKILPESSSQNLGFGYRLSISDNHILISGFRDAFIYTINTDTYSKIATLQPSDKATYGRLGEVKLTADLAAIGDYEDLGSTYSGSVFLFEKAASGWANMTETAKLTAANTQDLFCHFGESLSILNNEILVGAPLHPRGTQKYIGAAYLFKKPAGGWVDKTEDVKLFNSINNTYQFGKKVLLTETHAFISSPYEENSSVYIFEKKAGNWIDTSEDKVLSQSDTDQKIDFGLSAAISNENLIIGSPISLNEGGVGKAYIYKKPVGGWLNINNPDHSLSDLDLSSVNVGFGREISIDGNYAAITAIKDNKNGFDDGAVYVFKFFNDRWTKVAKLTPSDGSRYDNFGSSVAMKGDKIIVGCADSDQLYPDGSVEKSNTGAAYIFIKKGSEWRDSKEDFKLTLDNAVVSERFGFKVAIDENFAVVTSFETRRSYSENRKGYVYKNNISSWDLVATLTTKSNSGEIYFGRSLAINNSTIVIGSGRAGAGSILNTSFAYVYSKPEGDWKDATETAILRPKDHQYGSLFGYSVDIQNDYIIVGEPGYTGSLSYSGCAYIFRKGKTGWVETTEIAKLLPKVEIANANFGYTVAMRGNYVIAGSPLAREGKVYLFRKPENEWEDNFENQIISGETKDYDDFFGSTVQLSETNIFVGSIFDDYNNNKRSGSVHPYYITLPKIETSTEAVCYGDNVINLRAFPEGGKWSGKGIVNEIEGAFDPKAAGVGPQKIYYKMGDCEVFKTIIVFPSIDLNSDTTLCANPSTVQLKATPEGGLWAGEGIIDKSMGVFDPKKVGIGQFSVVYTANGCFKEMKITVIEENFLDLKINASKVETCDDKEIQLHSNITGTFDYKWKYSSTGSVYTDLGDFRNESCLATQSGFYKLELTSLCSLLIDSVFIKFTNAPVVNVEVLTEAADCNPYQILLKNPEEEDVQYEWQYALGLNNEFIPANGDNIKPTYRVLSSGFYKLKAVNESCISISEPFEIKIPTIGKVVIPNIITPNGDGKNDAFELVNLMGQNKITIFNRWGKVVFMSEDYRNNWKGDNLPNGVYYYHIGSDKKCYKDLKGWIQILR